jgi:hypothetical protein
MGVARIVAPSNAAIEIERANITGASREYREITHQRSASDAHTRYLFSVVVARSRWMKAISL